MSGILHTRHYKHRSACAACLCHEPTLCYLLFFGKERPNVGAPREAQIYSKKSTSIASILKEPQHKACQWKYLYIFCFQFNLRLRLVSPLRPRRLSLVSPLRLSGWLQQNDLFPDRNLSSRRALSDQESQALSIAME